MFRGSVACLRRFEANPQSLLKKVQAFAVAVPVAPYKVSGFLKEI